MTRFKIKNVLLNVFSCVGEGYSCQSSYNPSSCIRTSECVGDGTCRPIMRSSGTICRPAVDVCDQPERWVMIVYMYIILNLTLLLLSWIIKDKRNTFLYPHFNNYYNKRILPSSWSFIVYCSCKCSNDRNTKHGIISACIRNFKISKIQ